jgi:hypothetical protein
VQTVDFFWCDFDPRTTQSENVIGREVYHFDLAVLARLFFHFQLANHKIGLLSFDHLFDLSFTYLFLLTWWGWVKLLQKVIITEVKLRILFLVDQASLGDYLLKAFLLEAFCWRLILGVLVREVIKH